MVSTFIYKMLTSLHMYLLSFYPNKNHVSHKKPIQAFEFCKKKGPSIFR